MAKKENKLVHILKRPLFQLTFLVLAVVVVTVVLVNVLGNKGEVEEEETDLVGYQRLVNISDDRVYTYVDLEGKTRTYDGYKSMSDFYFDTTNVSRENKDDSSKVEYGIINKGNSNVVNFGEYENIIQVIGGKYYKVVKDNKFGIINYEGKKIFDPKYDYISVITVQDGKEVVFECQAGENYDLINENGKVFLSTTSKHDISYINSLNDNFDTIIKVGVDSQNKYYNLSTGDEVLAGEPVSSFTYNVAKEENKIIIYGDDYNKNVTIDKTNDYSADARVYFKKYVLVEQNKEESASGKLYTVYDENLKKVLEEENKVNVVQAASGEVYFIINDKDGVRIINEKGKTKKVDNMEFNSNSVSDLQALVLNPLGDSSVSKLYNFKGKLLVDNANDFFYKGKSLKVTEGEDNNYLLFTDNSRYKMELEDSVSPLSNFMIVENIQKKTTSLLSNDGKVILDKVAGTKIFYNKNYIGLQSDRTVNVYNVKTGKQTLSYDITDYIDRNETSSYVELKDGYYLFSGKKFLEKNN